MICREIRWEQRVVNVARGVLEKTRLNFADSQD